MYLQSGVRPLRQTGYAPPSIVFAGEPMTNHSSPEQLLRYLDGELSSSAMRKTAAHLQACWSCQVELDRLKQHIALIVDAEAEVFGPSLPSPPKPWPRIEPRLEKARQSSIPFGESYLRHDPDCRLRTVLPRWPSRQPRIRCHFLLNGTVRNPCRTDT